MLTVRSSWFSSIAFCLGLEMGTASDNVKEATLLPTQTTTPRPTRDYWTQLPVIDETMIQSSIWLVVAEQKSNGIRMGTSSIEIDLGKGTRRGTNLCPKIQVRSFRALQEIRSLGESLGMWRRRVALSPNTSNTRVQLGTLLYVIPPSSSGAVERANRTTIGVFKSI